MNMNKMGFSHNRFIHACVHPNIPFKFLFIPSNRKSTTFYMIS